MENSRERICSSITLLPQDSQTTRSLINEWLVRFGANFEKDIAPYVPIWQEELGGIAPDVLLSLFRRAMRTCKFFPKIAEILEPIESVKKPAENTAAEMEWEHIIELRRLYWCPDLPGGFSRGMPKLSGRVQQAARASGIFKLQDCKPEDLHVWARERFIKSFIAWGDLEQDKFLLPDGEIKNLLAGTAQAKVLPTASVEWSELHTRGLKYAEALKAPTEHVRRAHVMPVREIPRIVDVEGRMAELERQKKLILQKYPPTAKEPIPSPVEGNRCD